MKSYDQVRSYLLVVAVVLFAVVGGCTSPAVIPSTPPMMAKPPHDPVSTGQSKEHLMPVSTRPSEGSLWVDGASLSQMFINTKARQVGDIVTIKIVESSSATNKASTNTGRKSSLSVGLGSLFELQNNYPDNALFNPFATAKSDYDNKFDGSGTTARSGALTAYITARVIQILPSGNLFIEGNREVRINNENQVITLTGIVRPRDISSDNVVQSTYIADARISYSGSGVINEQQRPGWLARLLDTIWPF